MNKYKCFYGTAEPVTVSADTSYDAQRKAQERFQAGTRKLVKSFHVTVVLAEMDGETVVHTAVD